MNLAGSSLKDLLQAVLARPGEDAPRLVYADALSEMGDPRGEFIALQCAATKPALDELEQRVLNDRAERLLAQHRDEWLQCAHESIECYFVRGFVEKVVVQKTELLGMLSTLVAQEPVSRLVLGRGGLGRASVLPWVDSMRAIEFQNETDATRTNLELFFSSRRLARLSELTFVGCPFTKAVGDLGVYVAASVPRLSRLALRRGTLGSEVGLDELNSLGWFKALDELDLSENGLPSAAIHAFLTDSGPTKLQTLVLDANVLGDEGAQLLAQTTHFTDLRNLSLVQNRIGVRGAEALLTSPNLKTLAALHLAKNPITYQVWDDLLARFNQHTMRRVTV